ncbi:DNA-binding protein, partial [Acinetobacter baumannii]|nr:DNA-binding protein [Acinetobacter baumannii]
MSGRCRGGWRPGSPYSITGLHPQNVME